MGQPIRCTLGARIRSAARRIHHVIDALVSAIMAERGSGEASLLQAMAEASLEHTDVPMGRRAFRDEAAVLFMAGHETTANTLAWVWFILSQDPRSEMRLHNEVDAALGEEPAGYSDLVEETLRLYPPIPLQARKASGALEIGGIPVRKGDIVILMPGLCTATSFCGPILTRSTRTDLCPAVPESRRVTPTSRSVSDR